MKNTSKDSSKIPLDALQQKHLFLEDSLITFFLNSIIISLGFLLKSKRNTDLSQSSS